ncbi:MAG TPA: PleD family two-component system response regulator [Syntrophobacteraceae bacterium]|nr:PleD family two-component system response regulator [Syntrophobacteraceae bacterium]
MEKEKVRQTVLIVDDAPANIELLSEVLESEYEVLFALSGEDGLNIAFEEAPDLILLDIVMPQMDGYEVCARLKADPRTQTIPVIFVTAMDLEEDETKGLALGAIDYITKPIRPPIVRARVRNHLELKRYRDLLERLTTTDGLTGIANRRRFDAFLESEWSRARRSQKPLSLIMLDIDFFKAFNDHYGHLAGDDCLRQVAQCLDGRVRRPADLVARYGGEEFACLLPETNAMGAATMAKRFLESMNELNIPHAYSEAADHVTLSMGVATIIPLIGQPSSELVRRADQLLYEAKQNGRNQFRSRLMDPE